MVGYEALCDMHPNPDFWMTDKTLKGGQGFCRMHPNPDAWMTDETLKVSHNYNQKEIMTTLKLYGIMSSSLLFIGLVVTRLGKFQLVHILTSCSFYNDMVVYLCFVSFADTTQK